MTIYEAPDDMRWSRWPMSAPGRALTRRHREILRLLSVGLTEAEVGRRLGISRGTVKNHMTEAYGRLGIPATHGSYASLIRAFHLLGIIRMPEG
jgi:DNA-binding CsgD family transcriptional regulator